MYYSEKLWNRISDGYSKQPIADEESYKIKLAKTQEYFSPESTVFEFGCGTGSTAITHAPYVKSILGIDLSTDMVKIARDKAKQGNIENVTFERALIDDYPLEENQFDVVMGMSILHLVEDRTDIIQRAFKALKPGGVFISSTVCLGNSMTWIKPLLYLGKLINRIPNLTMMSIEQLEQDLIDAGFEPEFKFVPPNKKSCFFVVRKPLQN